MEAIPAAQAMHWSIELDKGLRSDDPKKRIMAITLVGPQLRELSAARNIPRSVASMYGLVPGEDQLFANAILLRLTAAFKNGDNDIRAAIVRSLLLEFRELEKKGKQYDGILSKSRVPNCEEMLKRVKFVFDKGDSRAKVLALRLFGCLADLAKDSATVRYLVLSSLQSDNASEIKAALFTIGSFCMLSEDFACIALVVLENLICSKKAYADVILTSTHVFARMWCTLSITQKAYKLGKRLALETLEDLFKANILIALTRLALQSRIFVAEQLEILRLFLKNDFQDSLAITALKCIRYLYSFGTWQFPVANDVTRMLLLIIETNNNPAWYLCDALRTLQKVFRTSFEFPDLSEVIKVAAASCHSSDKKMRMVAFKFLVELTCRFGMAKREQLVAALGSFFSGSLTQQDCSERNLMVQMDEMGGRITLQVIDCIESEITVGVNLEDKASAVAVKTECKPLFNLILDLAETYSSAAVVALDKLSCLIQHLCKTCQTSCTGTEFAKPLETYEAMDTDDNIYTQAYTMNVECCISSSESNLQQRLYCRKKMCMASELCLIVCGFLSEVLFLLLRKKAANHDACSHVKLLAEFLKQNSSCCSDTYEWFCLSLNSYTTWHKSVTVSKAEAFDESKAQALGESKGQPMLFTPTFWVAQELRALGIMKHLLRNEKFWEAYRIGRYCCHEGLWFAASYVFRKLLDVPKSDIFSSWFRSLLLLVGCEVEMKLLGSPKAAIMVIAELHNESNSHEELHFSVGETDVALSRPADLHNSDVKFSQIRSRMCSLENTLASDVSLKDMCSFQKWFICLRAKCVDILVDIIGIVASHPFFENNGIADKGAGKIIESAFPSFSRLAGCSLRLNYLAREYDLLGTSFLGIDRRSFSCIARLAFNCSLLAFCCTFSSGFANASNSRPVEVTENISSSHMVLDIVDRLRGVDSQITSNLLQLVGNSLGERVSLHPRTRIEMSNHMDQDSVAVCHFAVCSLLCIQKDAQAVSGDGEVVNYVGRVRQCLSDILQKWLELPYQVPKLFFRARPCAGAELFIYDAKPPNKLTIAVPVGDQVSLNICIQLRNLPEKKTVHIGKLYCILATCPSYLLSTGGGKCVSDWNSKAHKTGELVDLNDLLLKYIHYGAGKSYGQIFRDGAGLVTSCVSFDANQKGQGFSNCLLNVSAFPAGTYEIKWHACCVDDDGRAWSFLPLNSVSPLSIRNT